MPPRLPLDGCLFASRSTGASSPRARSGPLRFAPGGPSLVAGSGHLVAGAQGTSSRGLGAPRRGGSGRLVAGAQGASSQGLRAPRRRGLRPEPLNPILYAKQNKTNFPCVHAPREGGSLLKQNKTSFGLLSVPVKGAADNRRTQPKVTPGVPVKGCLLPPDLISEVTNKKDTTHRDKQRFLVKG